MPSTVAWKPANALKYLVESPNGPDERNLPGDPELAKLKPLELAEELTFALRDKMAETVPRFPTQTLARLP